MKNSEISKPIAKLRYGAPGHDREYVLLIREDIGLNPMRIPHEWEQEILQLVDPGWIIRSRGTRIEAFPPNYNRTEQTDAQLKSAVQVVLDNAYQLLATAYLNGKETEF